MLERNPAIDFGEMTNVATCPPQASPQQLALLDPSSQVMKSTPPLRKADEPMMRETTLLNQASPGETGQSWVSLHMLGVIQTKLSTWPLFMSTPNCVNGTTWAAQRAALSRMSV